MEIRVKVWLLFVVSLFAYIYLLATYEEPKCESTMWAVDVPRWLDSQVQPVRFDDGKWFNGGGRVIGSSATEDSDVCVR